MDADEPFTDRQLQDLADALVTTFGTPDEPRVPECRDIDKVLNVEMIRQAAGPVRGGAGDDAPGGLYRRHCQHCHGVTGDGLGPTASLMNPYPRDFRRGAFKFKSTPLGSRPTHDDLRRVIRDGIPNTAMPAFKLLPDQQIEALTHHVKFLSIRGQFERLLIDESSDLNATAGDRLYVAEEFLIGELLTGIVDQWNDAAQGATAVPPHPGVAPAESGRRGRELYFGEVAGCVKCHGQRALGDGQTEYFDTWTEALQPKRLPRLREYLAVGALPPRHVLPRNLREGILRGGRRPVDLYRRIRNGIDGTPMPAASMKPHDASEGAVGLTSDDIWHLVDYIRSLPYETSDGAHPSGEDEPLARITARQFEWEIRYPGADGRLGTVDDLFDVNELHVPLGDGAVVELHGQGVRHELSIPGVLEKRTIRPGQSQRVRLQTDESRRFDMIDAGPCGWGHYRKTGQVTVASRDQFERFLKQLQTRQEVSSYSPLREDAPDD